jgi:hypothetical protein
MSVIALPMSADSWKSPMESIGTVIQGGSMVAFARTYGVYRIAGKRAHLQGDLTT